MARQKWKTKETIIGNVYDFLEYKQKKPFFQKPMKITVKTPANDTYYMLKNVVYKDKQILALNKETDPDSIILVEAKIKDGQLKYISMLPDDDLGDLSGMLKGTI